VKDGLIHGVISARRLPVDAPRLLSCFVLHLQTLNSTRSDAVSCSNPIPTFVLWQLRPPPSFLPLFLPRHRKRRFDHHGMNLSPALPLYDDTGSSSRTHNVSPAFNELHCAKSVGQLLSTKK